MAKINIFNQKQCLNQSCFPQRYVGSDLKKHGLQLGRITGLDPAEPHFEWTHPIVRLDETDAFYVDVIHTDANPLMSFGLGLWQKSGHLDFYPNGGRYSMLLE